MRNLPVYPPQAFFDGQRKNNARLPFVEAPELRAHFSLAPAPTGILRGPERRRSTRYPFVASVEAVDAHSKSQLLARTSDLSVGGCYIETYCPFPLNAEMKLRISRERLAVVAKAKVVYSSVGQGMGLQFTGVDKDSEVALQEWINECSGVGSAPAEDAEIFTPGSTSTAAATKNSSHPVASHQPGYTSGHGTGHSVGHSVAHGPRHLGTSSRNAADHNHTASPAGKPDDVRYIISELIIALMRKGGLSNSDGKEMLMKLMPHD